MISLIGVAGYGATELGSMFPEGYGQDAAAIASKLSVVRYITVSSLAWITWDFFIILPTEISKIWKGRWSVPKTIFVMTRYSSLVAIVWKCLEHFYPFDEPVCRIFMLTQLWCGVLLAALIETIFIMQIGALYNRSRPILCGLCILFLIQMVSMSTFLGIGLKDISPLQRPGDWFTGCYPKTYPSMLWGLWIPMIIFKTFILFLAVSKSSYNACSRAAPKQLYDGLLENFAHDGIFYMGLILSASFICTMFWTTTCTILVPIAVPPLIALSSTCGCRIILNFPCLDWPPDHHSRTEHQADLLIRMGKDADLELNERCSMNMLVGKGATLSLPVLPCCSRMDSASPSVSPDASPFSHLCKPIPDPPPVHFSSEQEDSTAIQPSTPSIPHRSDIEMAISSIKDISRDYDPPCMEVPKRIAPAASWFELNAAAARPATILGHNTTAAQEDDSDGLDDLDDGLERPRRTHQRRWKSEDLEQLPGAVGPSFTPGFRTVTHPAPPILPEPPRTPPRSRRLGRFRSIHQSPSDPRPSQESASSASSTTSPHPLRSLPHSRSRLSLFLHRNRGEVVGSTLNPSETAENAPASYAEGETDIHTPLTRTPSRFSANSRSSSGRFRRMMHSSLMSPTSRHSGPPWSPGGRPRTRESDALTIDTVSTDWPLFDVDPRLIVDTPDMA